MSKFDIYNDVSEAVEKKKPKVIALLEEHIDFEKIIPSGFYRAFYSHYGRGHNFHLESYIRALLLQKILGIPTDKLLLDILKCSRELTDFCGFDKIPDGSAMTRFKQRFADCLAEMFECLVALTEPICREIDKKKSDYLIYDTTGISFPVAENNPKYLNGILSNGLGVPRHIAFFDEQFRMNHSEICSEKTDNPDSDK